MCTAVALKSKSLFFGRTLDNPFSYGENITVTPRSFDFKFTSKSFFKNSFAIIGMAHIENGYPLYYDAMNEKGLCMAGLNFVGNACYTKSQTNKPNIAVYEFIPWILRQCKSVKDAKELLPQINLSDIPFNNELPNSQLHWLIADKNETITVESVKEGIMIYNNPVGVLTNNPPFKEQLFNLNNYMQLSPASPKNLFSDKLDLQTYSYGMGALGLPGDLSSVSRFIRAAFTKMNSLPGQTEEENISQFFHILGSVSQTKGCCDTGNKEYEYTLYTSCCHTDKGIYFYTTYGNRQITAINMHNCNLAGKELALYPLINNEQIMYI